MRHFVIAVVGVIAGAALSEAADTQNAVHTRTKKLQTKITVEFKDTALGDAIKELKTLVEETGVGSISFYYAEGISKNQPVSAAVKDKPVAEVLDLILKKNGLGYIVVSKEKDRYDGWIHIRQGKERGYPDGQEPGKAAAKEPAKDKAVAKEKPMPKDKPAEDADKTEQRATSRLAQAELLLKDGKKAKAKQYFEEIVKQYPQTKAAEKARQLLEKLEK